MFEAWTTVVYSAPQGAVYNWQLR